MIQVTMFYNVSDAAATRGLHVQLMCHLVNVVVLNHLHYSPDTASSGCAGLGMELARWLG